MSIGVITHLPGPRPGRPVPAADDLEAAVYREFLCGFGHAPGVDLGDPVHYARSGDVYRQRFERRLTLANVGGSSVEVELDGDYRDLEGSPCSRLTLAPRSGAVLLAGNAGK